jgi:hypothetical protein
MPVWGPVSRRVLIQTLRTLGFEGPFPGGNHMLCSGVRPGCACRTRMSQMSALGCWLDSCSKAVSPARSGRPSNETVPPHTCL